MAAIFSKAAVDVILSVVRKPPWKMRLLSADEICGQSVNVTRPWHLMRQRSGVEIRSMSEYAQDVAQGQTVGVVYGVPADFVVEQIASFAGALYGRRLTPIKETADDVYTAALTYSGELPHHIEITPFLKLRVYKYSPRPRQ